MALWIGMVCFDINGYMDIELVVFVDIDGMYGYRESLWIWVVCMDIEVLCENTGSLWI